MHKYKRALHKYCTHTTVQKTKDIVHMKVYTAAYLLSHTQYCTSALHEDCKYDDQSSKDMTELTALIA